MSMSLIFRTLAMWQSKRSGQIVALAIAFTLFHLVGATFIYLETDFSKFSPQDMPVIVMKNKVRDTFSGQDTMFILVELDTSSTSSDAVRDIRDPRVLTMLSNLEKNVREESGVDTMQSPASLFAENGIPNSTEGVRTALEKVPYAGKFYNRDYSATTALITSNVGTSPDKINELKNAIDEDIGETPKPPGVKLTLTGMSPIRVLVADILVKDAKYTIVLASAVILLLLIVVTKSVTRGYLVFNPLVFALIWTLGTMGWLGIPLSMVTTGVGAMILGLGVEYSIFIVSKYEDERELGKTQEEAIFISLDEVGIAIVGSSTTTMVGFLALLLSIMPMMHDLGLTLAMGIFYCVVSSLVINPAFIVFEENTFKRLFKRIVCMGGGK